MMRKGEVLGAINLSRREPGGFSDMEVELLKTFADQAVIAIDNVRLFTELEEKNRALTESHAQVTEALEQQTATSAILSVISSSPIDVQPVFDTIAESAARLCEAQYCFVYRFEGQLLHFVAQHGLTAEVLENTRRAYPAPPSRKSVAARAVLERNVVQIPDVNADPDYAHGAAAAAGGYRSAAAVPILRDGLAIGSIAVTRAQAGLLPDRQIALLKTFADQAVIAIENVRLFTELEARNHDLTRALDRETATSEILRVISSSPTDVQPVFDAIVRNAGRLCGGASAALNIAEGAVQRKVAEFGPESFVLRIGESRPITRTSLTGRAMLEGRTIHIDDIQDAAVMQEYPDTRYPPGTQGCLATPLLHEGSPPVGVLFVFRTKGGPFTDTHSALLKTFADQAVIAIENVRLFTELQEKNQALTQAHAQVSEALEQQTATAGILRVISSSPTDVQPVFEAIAANAARLCDAVNGLVIRFDGQFLHLAAQY